MELKFRVAIEDNHTLLGSNRTFMELKSKLYFTDKQINTWF